MADPKGFLKYDRELPRGRDPQQRIQDYKEVYEVFPIEKTTTQAARCMDCGVPFCHQGCPLGNVIPEFNDAAYREDWEEAYRILRSTNHFPEFTGRICPAPCEASCVLGINQPAVAIEHIEKNIAEMAFERGYVTPEPPAYRTGKKVAVVGSGPAGLAAAASLNQLGHQVTVLERNDRVGGLLRYGIPDFKMEKWVLDRRLQIMEAEGVEFQTGIEVGQDISVRKLEDSYDAIVLAIGSTVPRDLPIPGRQLDGVHFAMDFLEQSNRFVAGDAVPQQIRADGKRVVVIGGGDTGSDCVGTSNRHGAESVRQIELLARPPEQRGPNEWPNWPMILRSSTSHEEGCQRQWAMMTKAFLGDDQGKLKAIQVVDVDWQVDPQTGKNTLKERPDSVREIPCDLALLAIGFTNPQHEGLVEQLDLQLDQRGNIAADAYRSSRARTFVAGDARRGQSLVVWAIKEGRDAALAVDQFLSAPISTSGLESSAAAG